MILRQSKLLQHSFAYETLLEVLDNSYNNHTQGRNLAVISFLANFAWHMHPGLFCDVRLDNWALQIGKKIWESDCAKHIYEYTAQRTAKKRVVHVATETYNVGGHTRLLLNLVVNDKNSVHSLVLTQQASADVPAWLINEIKKSGGNIISLVSLSLVDRVKALQTQLSHQADKIFYHIHPDDSVAIAALAAYPRPQVMAINHADHVFWLGSSLVDIVVCYRTWSLGFSERYRHARKVVLLPTPINPASTVIDFKRKARKILSIKEEQVLIITVASLLKFKPSGDYHYYNTIRKILDKNPNVLIKIVGVSKNDNLQKIGFAHHDRLELLGVMPNPQLYYEAADIYLDSMPFSSFTSLFEAMYFGSFPILQFNPVNAMSIENEPGIARIVRHSQSEGEQLLAIQKAIDDADYRREISKEGSSLIRNNYVGAGWNSYLTKLYEESSEFVNSINYSTAENCIGFNQDNIDAADLAYSFYGKPFNVIMPGVWKCVDNLTLTEIIDIYSRLKKSKCIADFMPLKSLGALIRYKLKKYTFINKIKFF